VNLKVVAIIQARMGSSRLPGKSLRKIAGNPLINLVFSRVSRATLVDQLVLATSTLPEDDILESWANEKGLLCFRGSSEDVLDRFQGAAEAAGADIVVRITADDPLKDPSIIDSLVAKVLESPEIQYSSNIALPSFPEGLDVEVFSIGALNEANNSAKLMSEREHVTPYIKKTLVKSQTYDLISNIDYSHLRWTVDYEEDLRFMEKIFGHFSPDIYFPWTDVINLIERDPSISRINHGVAPRNHGYSLSIEKEKLGQQ
jgi:spore coat polysaccharide biosynthesis protein SpsF (cytidylyltransferase family)